MKSSPVAIGRMTGKSTQGKMLSQSHIDFSKLQQHLHNIPNIDNSHLSRYVAKQQYFS